MALDLFEIRRPGQLSDRRANILLMRPALKPGLLPVWRNRDTVQIGIDPRRAVALTGMRGADTLLRLLDGSRDRAQVLAAASDLGMDAAAADHVLSLLTAAGALSDLPAGRYGTLPAGARARLAPELATAALARGDADGGARTLARLAGRLRAGARGKPGRLIGRRDAHRRGHRPGDLHRPDRGAARPGRCRKARVRRSPADWSGAPHGPRTAGS